MVEFSPEWSMDWATAQCPRSEFHRKQDFGNVDRLSSRRQIVSLSLSATLLIAWPLGLKGNNPNINLWVKEKKKKKSAFLYIISRARSGSKYSLFCFLFVSFLSLAVFSPREAISFRNGSSLYNRFCLEAFHAALFYKVCYFSQV